MEPLLHRKGGDACNALCRAPSSEGGFSPKNSVIELGMPKLYGGDARGECP